MGSADKLNILGSSVPAGERLHVWTENETFQALQVKSARLDLHLANSLRMVKQGEFYASVSVTARTPLSWPAGLKGQVPAEVCAAR